MKPLGMAHGPPPKYLELSSFYSKIVYGTYIWVGIYSSLLYKLSLNYLNMWIIFGELGVDTPIAS